MKRILVAALLLLSVALTGCGGPATTPGTAPGEVQDVELVMLIRAAQPEIGSSFEAGQPVRVKDTGTLLGEITDVRIEQSVSAIPDAQGELHAAESPVLVDIWLTVRGQATVSDAGYRFGSEYVYVNNDIRYLTPLAQFAGIITEMQVVGR